MDPRIKKFIVEHTHLKNEDIKPELRLAEDIGLHGLDAISFFEAFFDEFQIKKQEDFDSALHIAGGPDIAPRPLNWLNNLLQPERRKYLRPDVSLGHLQKVVESGVWTNER
ncbi:MAG TPA: hypothetical protein PL029_00745 [Bacteroidia bacterium]|nr:hypothetical protein [Bacteroidia bacterium]